MASLGSRKFPLEHPLGSGVIPSVHQTLAGVQCVPLLRISEEQKDTSALSLLPAGTHTLGNNMKLFLFSPLLLLDVLLKA